MFSKGRRFEGKRQMTLHVPPKFIFTALYKEGDDNNEIPKDSYRHVDLQFGDVPETTAHQ